MRSLTLVLLSLCLSCAHGGYRSEFKEMGSREWLVEEPRSFGEKRRSWLEGSEVEIRSASDLPRGLRLASDKSRVLVSKKYRKKYKVLGRLKSEQDWSFLEILFWTLDFHPSESQFRQTYCDVQVPLKILTLGLWVITPLHWPCYSQWFDDTNLTYHFEELREAAEAVGGNLVIVTKISDYHAPNLPSLPKIDTDYDFDPDGKSFRLKPRRYQGFGDRGYSRIRYKEYKVEGVVLKRR